MSRGWFILLAVLAGLSAALLYDKFVNRLAHEHDFGNRAARIEGDPNRKPTGERHERRLEHHLNRMTEELGLDESQRENLHAIRTSTFERLSVLRESTREKRQKIRRLLQAADLDSVRIRELSASLREDMAQLEIIATDNFIREAAVLTPEQREKHLEMRWFGPRGRGGGHGGWGRRHGRGPGGPAEGPPPEGPPPGGP